MAPPYRAVWVARSMMGFASGRASFPTIRCPEVGPLTTTFHTRLRGVDVRCDIADTGAIHVVVSSSTLQDGLPRVSRFAGYCSRTLDIGNLADEDLAWASAVADYYGFGLSQGGQLVVQPRPFSPAGLTDVRAAFNERVGQLAQSAVPANDSAHV